MAPRGVNIDPPCEHRPRKGAGGFLGKRATAKEAPCKTPLFGGVTQRSFRFAIVALVLFWTIGFNYYLHLDKLRMAGPQHTHAKPQLSSGTVTVEAGNNLNITDVTNDDISSSRTNRDVQDHDMFVLPNVLLIGAQKAGTTSVSEWLFDSGVCRPKVFDGEPIHYGKEVHFFDTPRYEHGIEFYAKRFRHCADENNLQLVMDATPEMLRYPERVHETYMHAPPEFLSSLKLMVILREPLSRELSLYNHLRSDFMETKNMDDWYSHVAFANGTVMSFDHYIKTLVKPYWNILHKIPGKYVGHLKKWHSLFGRDKLLVLSYDELQQDPRKFQWRVEEFLGTKILRERSSSLEAAPRFLNRTNSIVEISEFAQRALGSMFARRNQELYTFLDTHKGPPMEERPFRQFKDYGG